MSEWKEYSIGELGTVITGKTPSKNNPGDWGNFLPFVTPTDFKNYRKYAVESERKLSEVGLERFSSKILPPKSVLVTCIGSDMGKVVMNKIPVTTNQQINSVIPNTKIINEDFLYYQLVSIYDTLKVYGGDGTAVPIVNKSDFESIELTLPPLPEQKAIAGVLSSLDDKIDLLHRQNKTLEAMAETLFRQWFVEEADDDWERKKFGDLVIETIGGDWGEESPSKDSIPVICLRGVDLQNIKDHAYSFDAPVRYLRRNSLEKRNLLETDILLAASGIGPIGKTLPINDNMLDVYDYPVVYSNFCKRLRAESKAMAYFTEFMMYQLYKLEELTQFHSGTSIPNFNLKDFLNYEITIPPKEKIMEFSSFLTLWYEKKFNNQIRTLERLRDTLLPKLMSGEILVS